MDELLVECLDDRTADEKVDSMDIKWVGKKVDMLTGVRDAKLVGGLALGLAVGLVATMEFERVALMAVSKATQMAVRRVWSLVALLDEQVAERTAMYDMK